MHQSIGAPLDTQQRRNPGTVLKKNCMNNLLQTIYQKGITHPLSTITSYDYDTQDNLASVTDPRTQTTQYAYDDFGRKNQTTSPDTGTTKYEYDEAGNLAKRVDANGTTVNYSYDALNRLTAITFPNHSEQDIAFTYDSTSVTYGNGRLTGRADPSGSYAFHYHPDGNFKKEVKTVGTPEYATEYTYNLNNVITSIIYPTGRTLTYILDETDKTRISEVRTTINGSAKTLASSISYLPYGGITGLTYGNAFSLNQGSDNQYRASSIVVGSILNRTYDEYDANGNVQKITDHVETYWNRALDQAEVYTYGETGTNLLTSIFGQVPVAYTYDDNGNTTSANNRTFVYDLCNQLFQVWDGSNKIAEYTYNGAGQRIKKVTQTETRIFHYDLWGHITAETDQYGTMIAEYVYIGDQLLAMITKPAETEVVSYFHNDHLGTPQILTNDSQNIVWKTAYTPFGGAAISIQTVENPFRLPGQYYDQETGLHYNYFRYYDPTTGRYITPDPIGLEGGINLFVYALNNPHKYADPDGMQVGPIIVDPPGIVPGGIRGVTDIIDGLKRLDPSIQEGGKGIRNIDDTICDAAKKAEKASKIKKSLDKAIQREHTPKTHPEEFGPVRGSPAKKNKETGEFWVEDKSRHSGDHYEVYRNQKDWEKGIRDRDVYKDGRQKRKF